MARFDGMEQGLGVWLWAILVAVLVAVLVARLVGALLGKLAGMRFHRKVDRTGPGRGRDAMRLTLRGDLLAVVCGPAILVVGA